MCKSGTRVGFLMVGVVLALHLGACAGSQVRVGTPGDAEVKALSALVTQAQDANGKGDLATAKIALLKARGTLAQASNSLVVHPRFMRLVNDLSMAEAAYEQAEAAHRAPVAQLTATKKAPAKAKKSGRKVSRK